MSLSRKRQMKRMVKAARKSREEVARDPEHRRDRVGNGLETCWAPSCTFSAATRAPEPRELVRVLKLLHRGREILEEVPHRANERDEEQQCKHGESDGRPDHGDRGGQPAGHVRLRHHETDRVLEDERQKDADKDDQERAADRPKRSHHGERPGDDEQRAHRHDKRDPAGAGGFHGAEPYACRRLSTSSRPRSCYRPAKLAAKVSSVSRPFPAHRSAAHHPCANAGRKTRLLRPDSVSPA